LKIRSSVVMQRRWHGMILLALKGSCEATHFVLHTD
jgi:hypothetical protein